jgi:hypothetical protein
MTWTVRNRVIAAGVLAVLVVGFLLFRPDTLFTDVRVDESLEEAFTPPATGGTGPPTSTPAVSAAVAEGSFMGIDHRAAGTVTVHEQNGRFVLRFEDNTDIQNGPDLYVWVLPSRTYDGGTPAEYLDLGKLTGNVGGQNYQLPESFDPDVHRTVLVWCLRFRVPFAAASLS